MTRKLDMTSYVHNLYTTSQLSEGGSRFGVFLSRAVAREDQVLSKKKSRVVSDKKKTQFALGVA